MATGGTPSYGFARKMCVSPVMVRTCKMKQDNDARRLLWPKSSNVFIRVVTLYVGQGDSTIVLVANKATYIPLLVDINLDHTDGGIDVPRLVADLVGSSGLKAFVNTHPHEDHLRGVVELADSVKINQVWHIGYRPSDPRHDTVYQDLQQVISKVKRAGGSARILEASLRPQIIGNAKYHVLSPSRELRKDVNDLSKRTSYRRMHEVCAVLKFGIGKASALITGDINLKGFREHIVPSQKKNLPATFLSSSHHGSQKFFWYTRTEGKPYCEGLDAIDPTYVAVSAPLRKESEHDHPHPAAMKLYADVVGKGLFHTGAKRASHIFDIHRDGSTKSHSDEGVLAKSYPLEE